MLEDLTMEKKNRSLQPQTKGNGTDSKKTPDAQNGKQFPRSNRKREPTGSTSAKNEPRRPPPQKGKIFDKRPKPRGMYYGSRKENTQITEEEFEGEFWSLFNGGTKKQSLNHLLNFHYEPRGVAAGNVARHHNEHRNYTTKSLMSTHAHKYNKEQFLQANCQFVVRANGDYNCYLGDPDLLVDWTLVELIRTGSSETVTCPICLYPPTAAKITRCGHIFCWACILHYLALSDKTWRKCPICYEAVHNKDLKSVECFDRHLFTVGEQITLQLMKREKGSLIATPVNEFQARANLPILELSEQNLVTVYSKLLLAQRSDIDKIISREEAQLKEQVKEFEGCPELCFVEQAIEALKQRIVQLDFADEQSLKKLEEKMQQEQMEVEGAQSNETVIHDQPENQMPAYDYFEDQPITQLRDSMSGDEKDEGAALRISQSESCSSDGNEISVEDLYMENPNPSQPVKYFYFYQSIDGQEIYLHSINLRMLERTYGTLEHCPSTIQGKILEKEVGSMTGELRKRLRYLQHVPITCQFEVVELELHPSLISQEVTKEFQEQLDMRKRRRQRQARAEKRREKKIAEVEMRQFGRAPIPNLRIESHYHFPGCGEVNDYPRPNTASSKERTGSTTSSRSGSPIPQRDRSPTSAAMAALSLDPPSEDCGLSFAQMLREGKTMKSNESWPAVGGGASSMGKNVPGGSGAWGEPRRQRQPSVNADDDAEAYAFSPPARPSFNIAEALEAASKLEKDKEQQGGGRKKKKKQQKILFATGMPCPGN